MTAIADERRKRIFVVGATGTIGTATVRAISARAFELGFEPQYRCQIDNTASVALAKTSGFTLFGEWKVILPSPVEE